MNIGYSKPKIMHPLKQFSNSFSSIIFSELKNDIYIVQTIVQKDIMHWRHHVAITIKTSLIHLENYTITFLTVRM